jgi:uncharacterized membrane protein YbhN (UPF0104 family)
VVGGDGARAFYLTRAGLEPSRAAVVVFIERVIGLYALLLLGGVSAWAWEAPAALRTLATSAAGVATLGMAWAFLSRPRVATGTGSSSIVGRLIRAFARYRRLPGWLAAMVGWSLAFQGVSVLVSCYLAWLALGYVPLVPMFTLVPGVWIVTMLPVSLGGVGVRELAFIQLLAMIGVAKPEALFVSLGTYLTLIMAAAIGAVLYARGARQHAPGPHGGRHA